MVVRASLAGRLGVALGLAAAVRAGGAGGAEPLDVAVTSGEGCPGQAWFATEMRRRGLAGALRVAIGPQAGGEGFAGEIEVGGPAPLRRRLAGPQCQSVAEGLVLVAEVHLLGRPAPSPAASGSPPSSPATAASSAAPSLAASSVAPSPAASSAAPARPARGASAGAASPGPREPAAGASPLAGVSVALGAFGSLDTGIDPGVAWGGGVVAWLSGSPGRLAGLGLSVGYSQGRLDGAVPLDLRLVRARLDVVPVALSLGAGAWLGAAVFASGGALHAEASLSRSTPGTRSLWAVGLGPRLRGRLGPVLLDLGLDASLALTRRRFEASGLDGPLATLPRAGVGGTLSALVPLGR